MKTFDKIKSVLSENSKKNQLITQHGLEHISFNNYKDKSGKKFYWNERLDDFFEVDKFRDNGEFNKSQDNKLLKDNLRDKQVRRMEIKIQLKKLRHEDEALVGEIASIEKRLENWNEK